jgi:hypothetical protein
MVTIRLDDAGSSPSREPVTGWHCVLCGEAIDPGIEDNRKGHVEPRRNGPRPPGTPAASARGHDRRPRRRPSRTIR